MVKPKKKPKTQASTIVSSRLHTSLKTAKGRKLSSQRWLERQMNDPFVAEAKKRGLRSRAAFKLLQMDEKYDLLKKGSKVIDLGAAPGGWTQIALEKVGPKGRVIALDISEMEDIEGAHILHLDFLDEKAPTQIRNLLDGGADAVLSDMAAPATGHTKTDHLRIMGLAEAAYDFARDVLNPGGFFLSKVFQGGSEKQLLDQLKADFEKVRHVKPEASRSGSAEIYVLATGFRKS